MYRALVRVVLPGSEGDNAKEPGDKITQAELKDADQSPDQVKALLDQKAIIDDSQYDAFIEARERAREEMEQRHAKQRDSLESKQRAERAELGL